MKIVCISLFFILLCNLAPGQNNLVLKVAPVSDSTTTRKDSVRTKQLDILDLISKVFKIYLSSKPDTAKIPPGKLLLSYAPAIGYTVEGALEASFAMNGSFYTADPNSTSLSVIQTGAQYSEKHQLMVPFISNVWLANNKWDMLGDWRYYKYPSYTYGLGSATTYQNADLIDYSYVRVYQEILRHFSSNYYLGIGYNLDYHFGISDPTPVTDFPVYNNGAITTISSGLVAHFMYDNRTNQNNPKQAFYASVSYRVNSTILGSDQNWQMLLVDVRKYFKLSHNMVLAFWTWDEFTFSGMAPYLDLPSNGWDTYSNTGRGYIQGRFRGPGMLYGETEFRFGITKNGLLGGVVFVNATSVSNWPSGAFTNVFPGEGFGLRVKFNKYSDVNICIDYGFGEQNSRGLFFNLGEVF